MRVAVVDPLPIFRYGVVALLTAAGHEVETPTDALNWARGRKNATVLLALDSKAEWELLARLREADRSLMVVAVLASANSEPGVDAVRAGAASVISRSASPEALLQVMTRLAEGEATLPLEVVRLLAAKPTKSDGGRPPSEQIAWLRALAGGSTVATLANETGYSERAMFRLLHGLYRRMGVSTRTEALLRAHESGWLHS